MPYAIAALVLIWTVWMPLNFRFKKKGKRGLALVCKGGGTLTAVAFAAYSVIAMPHGGAYAQLMLVGLCISVCADVLLDLCFKVGGVLFFFAHVFYILAFSSYAHPTAWSLVVCVAALGVLLWVMQRFRSGIPGDLWIPLLLYAVALSMLLATGVPMPLLMPSWRSALGALGAALFVVSDVLLCRRRVLRRGPHARIASLGTYYMGQLLLACSTLLP